MKKIILMSIAFALSISIIAQANNQGKSKGKGKSEKTEKNNEKGEKDKKDRMDHEQKVWDGTYTKQSAGPLPSKNQPAKVRAAFQRDYPNATGVYWSKYRGDWTATFRNGIWMSTAVYHANGDRRDTRTSIRKDDIPRKIFDIIINKPETRMDDVIKIEVPKAIKDIFRIKNILQGKTEYTYYNSDGIVVQYNY